MKAAYRVIATCCLCAGAAVAATAEKAGTVTWSEVREAIARTMCVLAQPSPPGGYAVAYGDRVACNAAPAQSALDHAVDAGFEEAQYLLIAVPPAFDFVLEGLADALAIEDPDERNRRAVEVYFNDTTWVGVIMRRLLGELDRRGIACDDCPAAMAMEPVTVTWDQFVLYVVAWVRPTQGGFRFCSGEEVATKLSGGDQALIRASFVGIVASQQVLERVAYHLLELSPGGTKPPTPVHLAALHTLLPQRLQGDAEFKRGVCEALLPYSFDLGVSVTGCF